MTIKFHENIKKPYLDKFIKGGFNPQGYAWSIGNGISIYSGAQPKAIDILNNWSDYKSDKSIYLAQINEGGWVNQSSGILLKLQSGFSTVGGHWAPIIPVNDGTATWAILWSGYVTQEQMANANIPIDKFLVVNVSDANSDGIVRFYNTTFIAGIPVIPYDGTIGASIV